MFASLASHILWLTKFGVINTKKCHSLYLAEGTLVSNCVTALNRVV